MIYTAPCAMFWMRTYPLLGHVGGAWAPEFESFLGPVKWHLAIGECHLRPKKLDMDMHASKTLCTGLYKS